MNWDRQQWKRERLVGKIQERYGLIIQAVEKQVQEFLSSLRAEDTDQVAKGKAHHD